MRDDDGIIPVDAVSKRRPLDPATALRLAKIRRSLARINNLMGKLRDLSNEARDTLSEHEAAFGSQEEDRPDRNGNPPPQESRGGGVGRPRSPEDRDRPRGRSLRLLDRPE